jgi:hypothetical protein
MGAYVMLVTQAPTPLPPAPTLDPNFLASQLIPLIAMVAGLVALGWVARWFFRSPIAEALAEGIRMRRRRRWGLAEDGAAEEPRVAALEEQVRALAAQVSELGERLDFTERMLVGGRERSSGAGG